ncbi:DNA sulfur modification protein DndE [Proteiniclasticum sp. BAD-10]|uniref:DNA sulfur modification protein DndE n=1 Tax=Proteiniclasticum sediminis TaxID=2804028 RepID=A0A941HR21_9CLOT|nr:DNA sulfur modification protein DndE [Proteiniclasticum sediminis]MBR0576971.1 DNA sulfur modification protein DndE [Proteiniclasticum sediminis]
MKYKMNLSKDAEVLLRGISNNFGLTPNIICRYALIFSLKDDGPLDFEMDNKGIEFQRYTLTGEYDVLFRELIKSRENRQINDDDYFSLYLKAHIEKGLRILENEIKLVGSFDKLLYEMVARGGTI